MESTKPIIIFEAYTHCFIFIHAKQALRQSTSRNLPLASYMPIACNNRNFRVWLWLINRNRPKPCTLNAALTKALR